MCILNGLEILHSEKIVHMDIKPANLICFENSDGGIKVKISDFDVSFFYEKKSTKPKGYTKLYASSEFLNFIENTHYEIDYYKCDIYSSGATMLHLMLNTKFKGARLLKSKNKSALKKNFPHLYPIVKQMVSENDQERPSLQEIQLQLENLKKNNQKEQPLQKETEISISEKEGKEIYYDGKKKHSLDRKERAIYW